MEKSIMRTLILCLLITPLFQGCTSFQTQGVQGERRVALVIGNSDYVDVDWGNLPSVKKDVEDMTNTLRSLGFHVLQVKDADKDKMELALQAFKELLKKEANTSVQATSTETEEKTTEKENTLVALFYYAGHGLALGNETYLVPIGMKNENLSEEEYLNKNALTRTKVYEVYNDEELKSIKKRINFIILDACRTDLQIPSNNTEPNKDVSTLGPDTKIANSEEKKQPTITSGANPGIFEEMPPHTFLAYATAKENPAYATKPEDDPNNADKKEINNSIYTGQLLRFISIPGLPISELFGKVNEAVVEETKQIQKSQKLKNENLQENEKEPTIVIQDPHFSSNEISSEVNFVFRKEAVNQAPRW